MPTQFFIQLYNPDQQILVKREQGMLGSPHYDFSMPQSSFRLPSGSMLDKGQNDPAASATTTQVNFSWKKEGKLSKDFTCFHRGKSTDVVQKKKSKEPDIAVAMFKSLREVTVYEPNLRRVEMEDAKGLEVVLLLGATVIRDVFHGQLRQAFNVSDTANRRRTSSGARAPAGTLVKPDERRSAPSSKQQPIPNAGAAAGALYQKPHHSRGQSPQPYSGPRPPPADPRTQWEIDAETARLKAEADSQDRERRRKDEIRRRERERSDEEEARRLQSKLEAEEKERRRKARSVEKETERLRKLYGVQQVPNGSYPQRHGASSAPIGQGPFRPPGAPRPQPVYHLPAPRPPPQSVSQPQRLTNGLYSQAPSSQQNLMSGALSSGKPAKKSVWNLRSRSEDHREKLNRKSSSVF